MGAVVTQLICIVIATAVYFPFVKVASRRAEQAQKEALQNQSAAVQRPV
jgi:PTS system cellobiose-specific IIC component